MFCTHCNIESLTWTPRNRILVCRYVKLKLWKSQHPDATKREIEEHWRQVHKAVSRQLAPCLTETHEHPPLAQAFNFLDTVQALNVPSLALTGSSSCLSISFTLPGGHSSEGKAEVEADAPPCALAQEVCPDHLQVAKRIPEGYSCAQGCCADVQEAECSDRYDLELQVGCSCQLFSVNPSSTSTACSTKSANNV